MSVTGTRALDGGSIGAVTRCALADGRRIVAKTEPTPLDAEARALRPLADAGLSTSTVFAATPDLLVLDFVPADEWTPAAEADFGRRIARRHRTTRATYGYPESTWTGRLELPNEDATDWSAFVAANRLRPTARAVRDADGIPPSTLQRVDAHADTLHQHPPQNPPAALLHGDAWTNNAIPVDGRVRAILDPTPWYGDPARAATSVCSRRYVSESTRYEHPKSTSTGRSYRTEPPARAASHTRRNGAQKTTARRPYWPWLTPQPAHRRTRWVLLSILSRPFRRGQHKTRRALLALPSRPFRRGR